MSSFTPREGILQREARPRDDPSRLAQIGYAKHARMSVHGDLHAAYRTVPTVDRFLVKR